MKFGPAIVKKLESVVTSLSELTRDAERLAATISSAIQKLYSLKGDHNANELREGLLECMKLLTRMHSSSCTFMSRIAKFFRFMELDKNELDEMESSFDSSDFRPFDNYVSQLKRSHEHSTECYRDYRTYYDSAKEACRIALQSCRDEEGKVEKERSITTTAGKAVTMAGAAAGVGGVLGLSAVAGLLTFGIGTPIVLGLGAFGAGGVIAAGAATSQVARVTTNRMGEHYQEADDTLKDIEATVKGMSQNFESMDNVFSGVDAAMASLSDVLILISDSVGPDEAHQLLKENDPLSKMQYEPKVIRTNTTNQDHSIAVNKGNVVSKNGVGDANPCNNSVTEFKVEKSEDDEIMVGSTVGAYPESLGSTVGAGKISLGSTVGADPDKMSRQAKVESQFNTNEQMDTSAPTSEDLDSEECAAGGAGAMGSGSLGDLSFSSVFQNMTVEMTKIRQDLQWCQEKANKMFET